MAEEVVELNPFGKVSIYRYTAQPKHVVLFVSGDGGWNLGVVDMAKALASLDALVAGVDIVHYLRVLESSNQPCSYPAADFERLSQFIQQRFDYPEYVTPILVGYSSGATLVYATLVQAPSSTFRGAIGLGFCPDLPLTRPLCRGSGLEWKSGPQGKGTVFLPSRSLEVPWIVLQGAVDQVCNAADTRSFIEKTSRSEIVLLPNVGHGFSVERNWLPQFKQAFARITQTAPPIPSRPKGEILRDLPLVEVLASVSSNTMFAIHLTGDGGWGVTDKGLATALAASGIPVVGLNSLQYFWKKRTPDEASADLGRILNRFLASWKKEKVLLIGYSLGADVLPFMINRLPENLRSKIQAVVLLGPGRTVDFEFHFSDWLGKSAKKTALLVPPEIERLRGKKILCIYGENDGESCCRDLDAGLARVIVLKGGHRIGDRFDRVAETILKEIQ